MPSPVYVSSGWHRAIRNNFGSDRSGGLHIRGFRAKLVDVCVADCCCGLPHRSNDGSWWITTTADVVAVLNVCSNAHGQRHDTIYGGGGDSAGETTEDILSIRGRGPDDTGCDSGQRSNLIIRMMANTAFGMGFQFVPRGPLSRKTRPLGPTPKRCNVSG